jgi:uncharacterized protein (TIGR02246 family)
VEQVRLAIEESNARFSQALAEHDLDAVGGSYTADAVLLLGALPAWRGRESIVDFFRQAFSSGLTELRFATGTVRVVGTVAVEEGEYVMVMNGSEQRGRYVVVHEQQPDGEWRVLYDVVQPA